MATGRGDPSSNTPGSRSTPVPPSIQQDESGHICSPLAPGSTTNTCYISASTSPYRPASTRTHEADAQLKEDFRSFKREMDEKLGELTRTIKKMADHRDSQSREYDRLRKQLDEEKERRRDEKEKHQEDLLKREAEIIRLLKDNLKTEQEKRQDDREKHQRELRDKDDEIQRLQKHCESLKAEVISLNQEIEEQQSLVQSLQREVKDLGTRLKNMTNSNININEEMKRLRGIISKQEAETKKAIKESEERTMEKVMKLFKQTTKQDEGTYHNNGKCSTTSPQALSQLLSSNIEVNNSHDGVVAGAPGGDPDDDPNSHISCESEDDSDDARKSDNPESENESASVNKSET